MEEADGITLARTILDARSVVDVLVDVADDC
jgi:hypothetical protein